MQTMQFTRDYDHREKVQKSGLARRVSTYRANGGPAKDGVYEVSDKVAEAATADGAAQPVTPPADPDAARIPAPAPTPASTDGKKTKVTEHQDVRG